MPNILWAKFASKLIHLDNNKLLTWIDLYTCTVYLCSKFYQLINNWVLIYHISLFSNQNILTASWIFFKESLRAEIQRAPITREPQVLGKSMLRLGNVEGGVDWNLCGADTGLQSIWVCSMFHTKQLLRLERHFILIIWNACNI